MELTGHLSEDQLIAYFAGEMDPDRMKMVETHVRNCPPCKREFAIYRTLFSGLIAMLKKGDPDITPARIREALQDNLKKNQVFYSILHIPHFSSVLVAKTHRGLAAVIMGRLTHFEFEERLKRYFPKLWIVESLDETEDARLQFEQYFFRERREFDLPVDPALIRSDFQKQVLEAIREIPYGHFITYGALARRIGKPKATQAVGRALGANPLPIIYPCHRVVAGRGRLGGFSAGEALKLKLLEIEGVHYPHSSRQLDLFAPFEE